MGDLSAISEKDYAKMLADAKLLKQAKIDAAAKAEAEAKAKAEAERIERERIAAENARLKAEAIAREGAKGAPLPRLYVQVNTGEEPQKAGIAPREVDAFLARLRRDYDLHPQGLMCIPPAADLPGPHFALTAKLAERNGLTALSMGMSGDFETAIRFGATSVRVGSALFGARA